MSEKLIYLISWTFLAQILSESLQSRKAFDEGEGVPMAVLEKEEGEEEEGIIEVQ